MMTIYVLSGFNNYYNRVIKKFETLSDYEQFIMHSQSNYNFVPNDGVNTTMPLGSLNNQYSGLGDYVLITNELNEIVSRWFIIDSVRDRAGQYTLTVRRDLIADHFDEVINAPMFIEKATLNNSSVLLYNSENMSFNQIKISETLLMDESECPWLVGYYPKDATDIQGTVNINNTDIDAINISAPTFEDWEFFKYTTEDGILGTYDGYYLTKAMSKAGKAVAYIDLLTQEFTGNTTFYSINAIVEGGNVEGRTLQIRPEDFAGGVHNTTVLKNTYNAFMNYGPLNLNSKPYVDVVSEEDANYLINLSGKTIKTGDGKYYKITLDARTFTNRYFPISSGALFNSLQTIFIDGAGFFGSANPSTFSYQCDGTYFRLNYVELTELSASYNLTSANRLFTEDAPWNIFAIPYGEITVKSGENTLLTTTKETGISLANAIQLQNSGSSATKIYDIQLLPYCPVNNLITDKGELTVENNSQYSLVTQAVEGGSSITRGIIFNVPLSSFSFNINHRVKTGVNSIEKKLNNECDKWRLASPNYSNYFDFSVEKNKGVAWFNVDCTYKPFTPYIHVNPAFKSLYGNNDHSPRGLVLGGDFSLSQVIDQWESYQIQNKNFQNIFDRQIQNMNVTHKYQKQQDIVGGIVGVGAGAGSGALLGSMIAPGVGTAIGAVAGGLLSAAGGAQDIYINDKLRDEAKSLAYDMFSYQNGNIQALPQTISKVSAFNKNNKIFPVLEYYSCSNEEKIALINKVAWNGMTVDVIGKLKDYISNTWTLDLFGTTYKSKNYVKGQLIRLDSLGDDFHIVNSIAGELNKGVYIGE